MARHRPALLVIAAVLLAGLGAWRLGWRARPELEASPREEAPPAPEHAAIASGSRPPPPVSANIEGAPHRQWPGDPAVRGTPATGATAASAEGTPPAPDGERRRATHRELAEGANRVLAAEYAGTVDSDSPVLKDERGLEGRQADVEFLLGRFATRIAPDATDDLLAKFALACGRMYVEHQLEVDRWMAIPRREKAPGGGSDAEIQAQIDRSWADLVRRLEERWPPALRQFAAEHLPNLPPDRLDLLLQIQSHRPGLWD